VFSDSEHEEEEVETVEEPGDEGEPSSRGPPPPPRGGPYAPTGGVLASLRGVSKYLTLKIRGTIQGQHVSVLVDSGGTHNFINAQIVKRRGIKTTTFEGFLLLVHSRVVEIGIHQT